jgi:hypothetical protein
VSSVAMLQTVYLLCVKIVARVAATPLGAIHDRLRWGSLGKYIWRARHIPSWTRGCEAAELAKLSYSLGEDAVIVEIGSFLGTSAVLLGGARKLRGSGRVHCVDPFDASGDDYSASRYCEILRRRGDLRPLRERFQENIVRVGLQDWVEVHAKRSHDAVTGWVLSIDLLFMDGAQTYAAVMEDYNDWSPHLKIGGILAIHNSVGESGPPNGHWRLVNERIRPPYWSVILRVGVTTFARKLANDDAL